LRHSSSCEYQLLEYSQTDATCVGDKELDAAARGCWLRRQLELGAHKGTAVLCSLVQTPLAYSLLSRMMHPPNMNQIENLGCGQVC